MKKIDAVRAWKDPLYRASLSPEEAAQLPEHPSGLLEIQEQYLRDISGRALTTALKCTEVSYNNFRSCCPK
jgi:mersacidin/lichenicidin family type 2 lantibiotic